MIGLQLNVVDKCILRVRSALALSFWVEFNGFRMKLSHYRLSILVYIVVEMPRAPVEGCGAEGAYD